MTQQWAVVPLELTEPGQFQNISCLTELARAENWQLLLQIMFQCLCSSPCLIGLSLIL